MVVLATFNPESIVMFLQQVGKAAAMVIGFVKGRIQALDHRTDGRFEDPFVAIAQ